MTETNSPEVWEILYGKKKGKRVKRPRFKVGDRVRLNEKFRTFKKGYLPGWTEEVFVVKRVQRGKVPTYKVDEWDGTPIQRYLLRAGFAEGDRGGRRLVPHRQGRQTERE